MRQTKSVPVRWFHRACLALFLLVAGCSTAGAPVTGSDPAGQVVTEPGPAEGSTVTLPILGDLLREPAEIEPGLIRFRTAADTLAGQAITVDGSALAFTPDWAPATSGNRVPAWGGYSFNLTDYTGAGRLHVRWAADGAPEPGSWYLGLSDFASGSWEWLAGTAGTEYDIPGSIEFTRSDGAAYVAVVVLGSADRRLEWLRIGGNLAPTAELDTGVATGPAPLETTFDATASSDLDGSVTGYEWDLDGDGEFNETGAEVAALGSAQAGYTFESAGSYNPAVRVTDDAGATAVRSVAVDVASSAMLSTRSWGSGGEDVINAVLAGPDGSLYLAGSTTGFGLGQSDVLVLKYSAEGELLWSRTWGAVGVDYAAALALNGPDTLYVAGKTTIPDGGDVALVLEYGTDGAWRETILWGTC